MKKVAVREIPSEAVLKFARNLQELVNLLVEKRGKGHAYKK